MTFGALEKLKFVCDATELSGFGHAARCLKVAQSALRRRPNIDILFQGQFSQGARKALANLMPEIIFLSKEERCFAEVALIDRMSDFEDIEACDLDLVGRVVRENGNTIYLASGVTAPPLPDRVVCLGYQPDGPSSRPPNLYWGLNYAPVSSDLLCHRILPRYRNTALVAFGGAPNDQAIFQGAQAIARISEITRVTVLCSPIKNGPLNNLPFRLDQEVSYLHNLPCIGPLLAQSGIVLTSFGNLGYEALALGAPLCLVGSKGFQRDLADSFARMNIATTAGLLSDSSFEAIAVACKEALERADELSSNGREMIDGHGIDRIANLLFDVQQNG